MLLCLLDINFRILGISMLCIATLQLAQSQICIQFMNTNGKEFHSTSKYCSIQFIVRLCIYYVTEHIISVLSKISYLTIFTVWEVT